MLKWQEVLVVSSDVEVRQNLAGILRQCGFEPVLAASVAESRSVLPRHRICIVFCEDQVVDGNYRDLVKEVERTAKEIPIIVVSRLGEWGEYLKAIRIGAFDYLPCPSRHGVIDWATQNALQERERRRKVEVAQVL